MKSVNVFLGSLGLCFLAFTGTSQAADLTCTNNDVTGLSIGDNCYVEPTYYGITIFEMALCTEAPVAPTTGTVADTTACEAVFQSTVGSLVEVQNGVTSTPTGTFTRPPDGTYTHAYLRMGNTFYIKGNVDFGAAHGDVSAANRYCVSPTATTDNETGVQSSCSGTTGATNNLLSTELTDFSGGSSSNVNSATVDNLTVYLLDAGQNLADPGTEMNQAGADGIFSVQTFPTSVTVDSESTALDANIQVSQGMTVSIIGANDVDFDSGPFSLELSVQ